MSSPRSNIFQRVTASVPLLVTVIVHIVLIGIAGYFVVSEQFIGKKNVMQASAATESVAQKQVEHRLQVARKAGGSSSSSPVSAARIFSNAENALQLPAMPELPSVGASSMSGMGFGKGIGAVGTGSGNYTGVGTVGGTGVGFVNMSFLGVTNQRVSKVVFIVDVGRDLLDIRKGGFEAFKIIREEIMKLVSRLPSTAEFNVVLYDRDAWREGSIVAFDAKLQPATVTNKQAFFEWLKPVNATSDSVGLPSVKGGRLSWKPKPLPNAGLDETLLTPAWARCLHFVFEMEPDAVYIIAGVSDNIWRKVSETELARRKRENDKFIAEMKRDGLDVEAVNAARSRALAKAQTELTAVNAKLKAAGKNPLIIKDPRRIFEADFQAELKRNGASIVLDTAGWTDKKGKLIWWTGYSNIDKVDYDEFILHISKLQRALLKNKAAINFFLFVGPTEKPQAAMDDLSKLTGRNGGKFELITTKRLQELAARDDAKK